MDASQVALEELRKRASELGWVTDLYVGGSAATGDYRPGVSDLDLVALVDGAMDRGRTMAVSALHRALDGAAARGLALGCVYVNAAQLGTPATRHPTWTHGTLVHRALSGLNRAELLQHARVLLGRPPAALLAPMTPDDVRAAARCEMTGYWAWAVRRPWLWLDPAIADLGLTTMARARHTVRTGELITKTSAIDQVIAPPRLVAELRARRNGAPVASPRLRTALIAWHDARTTVSAVRRG